MKTIIGVNVLWYHEITAIKVWNHSSR